MFIAGDDEGAKAIIAELVRGSGLVAIDAGPLHRARQLEGLALLGITLQESHNLDFRSTWKLLHTRTPAPTGATAG
ncbi:MAG: oxidoreductase [Chloroflexota bacterium]|nr:oxidoreductase [Chloroflexota bacterium]